MIDALMMAGGRGERMRATYGPVAKPLVRVRGVPLIERNLVMLLMHGFREVAVAVTASLPELGAWVESRGAALARSRGARLHTLVEGRPLGTIGVAAELRDRGEDIVVVNADNLVTLDLVAMRGLHRALDAAFTVATHLQPFRIPFGEVVVEGERVIAYREKPELPVRISSGTYVLGREALRALSAGERCDVPELVTRLRGEGRTVGSFHHDTPWIDVNDAAAVARAEALVTTHAERFERLPRIDREVVGALIECGGALLLEWRDVSRKHYPGVWDTPGGKLEAGEGPREALVRELREELGLAVDDAAQVATFDDLDAASGEVFRHHVFALRVDRARVSAREGQALAWRTPDELRGAGDVSPVVARSLAAWGTRP